MRWGNCLTASIRKRKLGTITIVWMLNGRSVPHFFVRDSKWNRLDVSCERWPGTIRFLGDELTGPSFIHTLWYQYEDVVLPPSGERPRGDYW